MLDASVALRWVLPAQADPITNALFLRVQSEPITVPSLWHVEVANQVGLRLRSGKLSQQEAERGFHLLDLLDIRTIPPLFTSPCFIAGLMRTYNLTAYDSLYLNLALQMKLPLATVDGALRSAALSANIRVLP